MSDEQKYDPSAIKTDDGHNPAARKTSGDANDENPVPPQNGPQASQPGKPQVIETRIPPSSPGGETYVEDSSKTKAYAKAHKDDDDAEDKTDHKAK